MPENSKQKSSAHKGITSYWKLFSLLFQCTVVENCCYKGCKMPQTRPHSFPSWCAIEMVSLLHHCSWKILKCHYADLYSLQSKDPCSWTLQRVSHCKVERFTMEAQGCAVWPNSFKLNSVRHAAWQPANSMMMHDTMYKKKGVYTRLRRNQSVLFSLNAWFSLSRSVMAAAKD